MLTVGLVSPHSVFKDKTIKLWKITERDKRPEGYNLKDEEGKLKDLSTVTSLQVSGRRPGRAPFSADGPGSRLPAHPPLHAPSPHGAFQLQWRVQSKPATRVTQGETEAQRGAGAR